jgi:hypothetical protein
MEWNDHNWKRYYDLDYKCRLSALYHRKRERYYALLDKFSTALALIAGSAAFSDLLHTPEQKSIAGGLVALVTLPSLVFAWSDNAKLHATLAARFIQIEAEMQKMGVLSAQMRTGSLV